VSLRYCEGYDLLTEADKAKICNGAGAAGDWKSKLIPNKLWGLDCLEAFNIHDYAYFVGVDMEDKQMADIQMLVNLMILIDTTSFFLLRHARRRIAMNYYVAVDEFGDKAFFAG